MDIIQKAVDESALNYPVFIDSCGYFMRNNMFIPQESVYHTFLVDDQLHPILVGNPLSNRHINELFYHIIEEMHELGNS